MTAAARLSQSVLRRTTARRASRSSLDRVLLRDANACSSAFFTTRSVDGSPACDFGFVSASDDPVTSSTTRSGCLALTESASTVLRARVPQRVSHDNDSSCHTHCVSLTNLMVLAADLSRRGIS